MFGFAEEWLAVYGIGEIMQQKITDILGGKALTMDLVEKCRFAMKADLEGRNSRNLAPLRSSTGARRSRLLSRGLGRSSMCVCTST